MHISPLPEVQVDSVKTGMIGDGHLVRCGLRASVGAILRAARTDGRCHRREKETDPTVATVSIRYTGLSGRA